MKHLRLLFIDLEARRNPIVVAQSSQLFLPALSNLGEKISTKPINFFHPIENTKVMGTFRISNLGIMQGQGD